LNSLKTNVRDFWERSPCGATDANKSQEGTLAFFEEVEKQRYSGDDFMPEVVGFDQWKGKKVLEVGCGLGTDLLQFARGGAEVYAVDLTEKAAALARKRLGLYGFEGSVSISDSESLPFPADSFDLVYSWGVIHHTPNTEAAAREIMRVCKPGGQVLVMLYHRRSVLAFQAWLFYGFLRGRPFQSATRIIAERVESPGTKVYTPKEARSLFIGLESIQIRRIVTRYDLRIGRRTFLPSWVRRIVPSCFGWFMVVGGAKA
jgi:ubiquinone/menaquinone biosynthesis C-methylase UbiE